jgi:hypothetical protein
MRTEVVTSLTIIAAVGTMTVVGELPGNTILWAAIQDACHAPAFGVLAIALLVLLRATLSHPEHTQLTLYLLSLAASILLGITTEVIQYYIQRDAEIIDVVRDSLGAVSILGVYFAIDPRVTSWNSVSRRRGKHVLVVISLLIFLCAFISLGIALTAMIARNHEFPVVCDFDSFWSTQYIRREAATLTPIAAPSGWTGLNRDQVVRLDLSMSEYPGITIEEPYPDWSSYHELCLDLYSNSQDTLRLGLRIDDIHHNYSDDDRFTCRLSIVRGLNRIRIPLEEVRTTPGGRETDMKAIQRIILFAHEPPRDLIVYLDRFWLE